MKLSNKETKNYCYKCDKRFSNEKDLSEHVKTCFNYPCFICGKKLSNGILLDMHYHDCGKRILRKLRKSNNIQNILQIWQQKTVKVTFNRTVCLCYNCYVLSLIKSLSLSQLTYMRSIIMVLIKKVNSFKKSQKFDINKQLQGVIFIIFITRRLLYPWYWFSLLVFVCVVFYVVVLLNKISFHTMGIQTFGLS